MKSISVSNPVSPIEAMTTAAVKVLLQFLTSLKANTWLAAFALLALMAYIISGNHSTAAILAVVSWVLHFATMSAIDIYTKGGEL